MITDEQKRSIAANVNSFITQANEYLELKNCLSDCENVSDELNRQLSLVAEEERQLETAIDVLYRQTKKVSRAKEIESQINDISSKRSCLKEKINQLEPKLLLLLRNLPIPVDLEKFQVNNSNAEFSYFSQLQFGNKVINAISILVRQSLTFNDVTIVGDKIKIANTQNKDIAIKKLVAAIQTFRYRVDDLAKSYENIDVLIERLAKSKIYPAIMGLLATNSPLSVQDMSKALNCDERMVYDGCYNLTRSNWSPTPILKLPSGQFELTLAGKILFDRLSAKYPQLKEITASDNGNEELL